MTAVGEIQVIKREDIPDAPNGNYIDRILLALSTNSQSLRTSVAGIQQPSFRTQKVTHGVPLRIKNPLGSTRPTGVVAVASDSGTLPQVSWRMLNSTAQPDQLELTALFDLQHTRPFLSVRKDATPQALASGSTTTPVTWQTLVEQDPAATLSPALNNGIVYVNSGTTSRIQVTEPGRYLFNLVVGIASNTTGFRGAWLLKNGVAIGAGTRPGEQLIPAIANAIAIHCSATFTMSTSDYVEGFGYQNSGVSLNYVGNGNEECWLQVSRQWSTATPSANVTFEITP